MRKWKPIMGVTLVFVLGVLVGSVGTQLYDRHRFERFSKDPAAERRAKFLKRLTRDLALNESQRRECEVIIGEMESKIEAMRAENRPQKVIDEGFARIQERLAPDQRLKLDELRQRQERHIRERRGRSHFP